MKLNMQNGALEIIPETTEEKLALQSVFLGLGGNSVEREPNASPIGKFLRERIRAASERHRP